MAGKRIDELQALETLSDDALLLVQQDETAMKMTAENLKREVGSGISPVKVVDLSNVGSIENIDFSRYAPGDVVLIVQSTTNAAGVSL